MNIPKKMSFDEAHAVFQSAPEENTLAKDDEDFFNQEFEKMYSEDREGGVVDDFDPIMRDMSPDETAFLEQNVVRVTLTPRRAAITAHFKSIGMR